MHKYLKLKNTNVNNPWNKEIKRKGRMHFGPN